MSALVITLLRFAFLALLWIFVLIVVGAVRRDVFGTTVRTRTSTPPAKKKRPASVRQTNTPCDTLVVTHGPLTGTRLSLSNGVLMVGRAPDSSLVLDDGYASSRHARFFRDGDRVIVEDLNSTNGTWVGGVQIHEPTALPAGVPVTIGKTVLEVR